MESLSTILTKITNITVLIRQKHPQLYILLSETPLFLNENKINPSVYDFSKYLETLENQLKTFDTIYPTNP